MFESVPQGEVIMIKVCVYMGFADLYPLVLVLIYTPFIINYKQIFIFKFIQLMIYVVHNIDHIHH